MVKLWICTLAILILLTSVSSIDAADIWSDGVSYKITLTDNIVTVKDYTIKAVDFPAPVRGRKDINGSILPDNPVTPFVTFELYKDMVNNTIPIDKFSLGVGDEFKTSDREIKIVVDSMPDSMSQNWVYEYYNPFADIKIYKRAVPTVGISFDIDMDESIIDPGDKFNMKVKIKNTGEDVMKNINLYVEDSSKQILSYKLRRTLDLLDIDKEEKILDIDFVAPKIVEEKEYEIYFNITWEDVKNIQYSYNTTKIINVRSAFQLLTSEKTVSRDSVYLKEYIAISLNVVNYGHLYMDDVRIYDTIMNATVNIKDKNITNLSFNESSIGPGESWSYTYTLKPLEPGIYVLPKFKTIFSLLGENVEMTSSEAGFRVFGPKIILSKTAKKIADEVDLVEVTVTARNIGNGFAKLVIEDKLPNNSKLVSGQLQYRTPIDPGTEKIMNYTVRIPYETVNASDSKINITSWPPAKATYYLDDYIFTTSSTDKEPYYENLIWTIESEKEDRIKLIRKERKEEEQEEIIPTATLPQIEEPQKKVVATIPPRTPQPTEKSTPGFTFYEIIILVIVLILLGRNKK